MPLLDKAKYQTVGTDQDAVKPEKMSKTKERMYQFGMFSLCYIAWVFVHMQREFWAMSKEVIMESNPELPKTFFGWINTSLFQTYAICQLGTGAIGDSFPKRYVLAISFVLQAILFSGVGFAGLKNETTMEDKLILFCILFGTIGAIQSVDFPCFVGTVGAWTRRSSRGIITGIWATCGNVGNIIGL